MRATISGRSTVPGTSLRAIASVFASATNGFRLREVGIFNTTSTPVAVSLVRFVTLTGVGAALTVKEWDEADTFSATAYAGHTVDSTPSGPYRSGILGGAIGSGVIWAFGDTGIIVTAIPGGTNGIGIICPVGRGQILDYNFDWEE
jgi:hypothetical protein